MQLGVAERGFTGWPQGPLCAGDGRERHSAQTAYPIDTPVAPFHVAIERIVLLFDEALYATVEWVSDVAGMPAVAIIPPSGFAN